MNTVTSIIYSGKIQKDVAATLLAGLFFFPYIVFIFSYGDYNLYRISHLFYLVLLVCAILLLKKNPGAMSWQAFVITFAIFMSSIAALSLDRFNGREFDWILASQSFFFVALLLAIDRIRHIGIESFLNASRPLAIIFVLVSTTWFLSDPETRHGRYEFFGLHPNLGGELLFASICLIVFSRSRLVRWGFGLIILVMLFLLQSRAAIIASILVLFYAEWFYYFRVHGSIRRLRIKIGVSFLLISMLLFFYILLFGHSLDSLKIFALDEVLRTTDPHRGLDTGMFGREERWLLAVRVFLEHPIFGVGINRVRDLTDGVSGHNGFINLLAEVGILAIPIFLAMWISIRRFWNSNRLLAVILASSFFVFFFSDRSLNINAFPLIMWILILPWAIHSKDQSEQITNN